MIKMRLVSYNILDGGQGRADPLAEILLAQKADVIGLVEADKPEVLARIASRLGMELFHAPGKQHGVALLSRWPLVETINHSMLQPALTDCLLEARVRGSDGVEWTVGLLHLHPHGTLKDEAVREEEIATILRLFEGHRRAGRPHLLAGDFNANSPIQEIDPARCKPRTRKEWEENGGMLPRRAIQLLQDAGYVDTLHAVRGRWATTTGTFTTQFPGQRVDFIFTHDVESSRAKDAWIEQDRLARYASDHFPVGAEVG